MKKYEISISDVEQGTIDSVLYGGEEVLWRGKPKKNAYVLEAVLKMMPLALLWLAIDIAMLCCIFIFTPIADEMPFLLAIIIPFFIIHLAPVWIWIFSIVKKSIEYKNIEYAVTNRRIIIRSGLIGIDFLSLNYAEVQTVNINIGILDRLLKVGDILIVAQKAKAAISDIEDPYTAYKIIQKITFDIKSDLAYPNAFRPTKNSGYETDYKVPLGGSEENLPE